MDSVDNNFVQHEAGDKKITSVWSGLCFKISETHYVSDIKSIDRVLPVNQLTPVPGVHSWVRGIMEAQGELLIIVDLQGLIDGKNIDLENNAQILITNTPNFNIGILVSHIEPVKEFLPKSKIHPQPPAIPKLHKQFISGTAIKKEDIAEGIAIFDMDLLSNYIQSLDLAKNTTPANRITQ